MSNMLQPVQPTSWWQRLIIQIVPIILPVIIDALDKDPNNNFEKIRG